MIRPHYHKIPKARHILPTEIQARSHFKMHSGRQRNWIKKTKPRSRLAKSAGFQQFLMPPFVNKQRCVYWKSWKKPSQMYRRNRQQRDRRQTPPVEHKEAERSKNKRNNRHRHARFPRMATIYLTIRLYGVRERDRSNSNPWVAKQSINYARKPKTEQKMKGQRKIHDNLEKWNPQLQRNAVCRQRASRSVLFQKFNINRIRPRIDISQIRPRRRLILMAHYNIVITRAEFTLPARYRHTDCRRYNKYNRERKQRRPERRRNRMRAYSAIIITVTHFLYRKPLSI